MHFPVANAFTPLCRGPGGSQSRLSSGRLPFLGVRTIDSVPYSALEFVMAWRNASL